MSESDPVPSNSETIDMRAELSEIRGWLIGLGTLTASVTYQAGLNPPGSFWQDDNNGHQAGNPVLYDRVPNRYLTFLYFNATAFLTSLVIIILPLNKRFFESEANTLALTLTIIVDILSLVGAYIAGSTHNVHSSIYVIVLTCFLFVPIVYTSRVLPYLCSILLYLVVPLLILAENMKNRVKAAKRLDQDGEKRNADMNKKTRTNRRCCCCSCSRAMMRDIEETGQEAA